MARRRLTKQTREHFVAYIEKAAKAAGITDGLVPKKLIMDYSFVHQNIIPGWVEGCKAARGIYSLGMIRGEGPMKKPPKTDKITGLRKPKKQPKAKKRLAPDSVSVYDTCRCGSMVEITQRESSDGFVTEALCKKCGAKISFTADTSDEGFSLAAIELKADETQLDAELMKIEEEIEMGLYD
jgi:hypothetical protein